jgi:hypothetical protein
MGVVLLALVASGCRSILVVSNQINPGGDGQVRLELHLDQQAQAQLGIASAADVPAAVAKHFPWVREADGWSQVTAAPDSAGLLALTTTHAFDDLDTLEALMSDRRSLDAIAGDPQIISSIKDMPHTAPLLNDYSFRLGTGKQPEPGYNLFAQGGVGDVPDFTCSGDEITPQGGTAATLREALSFKYQFRLPGKPSSTSADRQAGDTQSWSFPFGDCPRIAADTGGGGSSSKVVNGLILAGAAGFILIVLGLRALRRRRDRRV